MVDVGAEQIERYVQQGVFHSELAKIIADFYPVYLNAIPADQIQQGQANLNRWLELVAQQMRTPYAFEVFHEALRAPFDFYQFGLDFMRPLVDFNHSKVMGIDQLNQISTLIKQKKNVVLLANHQTEPDPQLISLMIEKNYPKLSTDIIFVAGDRVTSDPLAVPMSLGRNLLCIYSKKHIDHPLAEKSNKILHNQKTLKKMQELLNQGGQCIYVAPSGGRDRLNAQGVPEVASFDPDSLELFWLLAKQAQAQSSTHFLL